MAAPFPDWNDLRDVLLITEAGTLSAAARAAGVSQSTMSRRLAAIEQLGQPVFLRDEGGRMVPNARGREICEAAQAMRLIYDALHRNLTDAPPPLRIAACDMSARVLLAKALPVWAARSSGGAALVVSADPEDAEDIDVRIAPMAAVPQECVGQLIGRVEMGLYASAQYAISHRIRGHLETMEGQEVICAAGRLGETPAYRWLQRQGGVITLLAADTAGMIEACISGMGVALLPVAMAEGESRLLRLDAPKPPAHEVWAVAAAGRAEEPQITAFFRWARSHFRSPAHRDRKAG